MEGGTYPRGPIMPMGSFLVSKKNQILEGTEGSLTKVQKIITSTKMKDNFYLISHFFSSQKTVFLSKLNGFSRIVGICVSPPMCCSCKIEATGQGRRPITGDGRGKEEEEDATSHSVLLSTSTAENQLFRATQEIEPNQLEGPNIPPILSNVY